MNIKLENIGIVKNSNIQLDGLTVITGDNSSGKTTVGKAIYSLIDAVSDISTKVRRDKCDYIWKSLIRVRTSLNLVSAYYNYCFRRTKSLDSENNPINQSKIYLLLKEYSHISILRRSRRYEQIMEFAADLKKELENFDTTDFILSNQYFDGFKKMYLKKLYLDEDNYQNAFDSEIQEAIFLLGKMFREINSDPGDIDYTRSSINETLRVEFSEQIQPVKYNNVDSEITVYDNENKYFSIKITNNNIEKDDKPFYSSGIDIKKTYFIDNPFVLDSPLFRKSIYPHDEEDISSILNAEEILPHESKLNRVLKSNTLSSVYEKMIKETDNSIIREKINQVLSGSFEFTDDGEFYVKDGKQLNITNLATGSKMFAIIKLLIEKGEIDGTTLLVLDEPEAHLHPNWQNKFAEIIVLIVKELGTRVLLTSHSPNFVLAIDAYMRKYNAQNITNFYQTNSIDGYFVEYKNVNDDIGLIYDDFAKNLAEMKALRDTYYYKGLGE